MQVTFCRHEIVQFTVFKFVWCNNKQSKKVTYCAISICIHALRHNSLLLGIIGENNVSSWSRADRKLSKEMQRFNYT